MPKATVKSFPISSSFEKKKWADEKHLRERELDIKQREVDKSVGSNPLFLAMCAAIVTAVASIYVASDNSKRQHELELTKAEQARILEAIRTGNPDKAAQNLQFMLDAGLITTSIIAEKLRVALSGRVPGTGPSLPIWITDFTNAWGIHETREPGNFGGWRNPTVDVVRHDCAKNTEKCSTVETQPPADRRK